MATRRSTVSRSRTAFALSAKAYTMMSLMKLWEFVYRRQGSAVGDIRELRDIVFRESESVRFQAAQ